MSGMEYIVIWNSVIYNKCFIGVRFPWLSRLRKEQWGVWPGVQVLVSAPEEINTWNYLLNIGHNILVSKSVWVSNIMQVTSVWHQNGWVSVMSVTCGRHVSSVCNMEETCAWCVKHEKFWCGICWRQILHRWYKVNWVSRVHVEIIWCREITTRERKSRKVEKS